MEPIAWRIFMIACNAQKREASGAISYYLGVEACCASTYEKAHVWSYEHMVNVWFPIKDGWFSHNMIIKEVPFLAIEESYLSRKDNPSAQ